MNLIKLLPVYLSSLMLAAHFLYNGNLILVAISLLSPTILLIRSPWTARICQFLLTAGSLEWIRSILIHVTQRKLEGQDWHRLAVIIGLVALFTALSALVFQFRSIKEIYRLN